MIKVQGIRLLAGLEPGFTKEEEELIQTWCAGKTEELLRELQEFLGQETTTEGMSFVVNESGEIFPLREN